MIGAALQLFVDRYERLPDPRITRGLVKVEPTDNGRREVHGWSEGWVSDWGYLFTYDNGARYAPRHLEPELRAWLERNPCPLPS